MTDNIINGESIHTIESALADVGFDATVVAHGPPEYRSSSTRPAAMVKLHIEVEDD